MKITRIFLAAGISLALASILSCSSDAGSKLEEILKDPNKILDGFMNITKDNILQNSKMGFMPQEGIPEGQTDVIDSVKISGSAISGGSTYITIIAKERLKEIYLQIGEEDGYYRHEINHAEEETYEGGKYTYTIVLQFYQALAKECEEEAEEECEEKEEIVFKVSALTLIGEQEAKPKEEEVKTKKAGSGALQVSLSWDRNDDVDLHVITPSRKEVYFGNRNVTTEGFGNAKLDIDSNAGCSNDGINSENVYFEAPLEDGEYTVEVHLYSKCVDGVKEGARYNVTAIEAIEGETSGGFIEFSTTQSGQFAGTDQSKKVTIGKITVRNGQVVR